MTTCVISQAAKLGHEDSCPIRLVVVTRRRLDGDALAALFHARSDFRVLCTTTSVSVASVVGSHRRPDVVVVDGGLVGQPGSESISTMLEQFGVTPLMMLDEEVNQAHLTALLKVRCVGYFTRGTPSAELAEGILRLARGESAFDSKVAERIHSTPHGKQFRAETNGAASQVLTPREIEVWKLIALGNSVRRCAELLNLAPSTVDNHKAHLMKKLGVHKALDLTRMAIRDGLVTA